MYDASIYKWLCIDNQIIKMPCHYCDVQFTLSRWKNTCNSCTKKYCSQCMNSRQCKSCHAVLNSKLKRQALMEVKVKDLKLYLNNRNQPTDQCKEKVDLILLIQEYHGIFEPDLAFHTETYNTAHVSNGGVSSTSEEDQFAVPSFVLPTYQETQNSFPTAQEFSATTSRTNQEDAPTDKEKFFDITDIKSVIEIKSLSVKQLKFILQNNFVNLHGIVEKQDLIQRVEILYIQHVKESDFNCIEKKSVKNSEYYEENMCKICLDNPVNCVFLECGHMMTCISCSKSVTECPICRQHIIRTVRVFKS